LNVNGISIPKASVNAHPYSSRLSNAVAENISVTPLSNVAVEEFQVCSEKIAFPSGAKKSLPVNPSLNNWCPCLSIKALILAIAAGIFSSTTVLKIVV